MSGHPQLLWDAPSVSPPSAPKISSLKPIQIHPISSFNYRASSWHYKPKNLSIFLENPLGQGTGRVSPKPSPLQTPSA